MTKPLEQEDKPQKRNYGNIIHMGIIAAVGAVAITGGASDLLFERHIEGNVPASQSWGEGYSQDVIENTNKAVHDPQVQQRAQQLLAAEGLTGVTVTPKQVDSATPWELSVSSNEGWYRKFWALRQAQLKFDRDILLSSAD